MSENVNERCERVMDLSLTLCNTIIDRAGRVIDWRTPVGEYVHELEASVIEAEATADDWRRRYFIAAEERARAEQRVGQLEGLLDARRHGINARIASEAFPKRRTPRLTKFTVEVG